MTFAFLFNSGNTEINFPRYMLATRKMIQIHSRCQMSNIRAKYHSAFKSFCFASKMENIEEELKNYQPGGKYSFHHKKCVKFHEKYILFI